MIIVLQVTFTDDQCDGPPLTETNWGAIFNSLPTGWRVPNVKELASLVAVECNNPSINETAFPNASTDAQWSSSPDVNDAESAWAVSFSSGLAQTTKKNTNTSYRLVKIQ